jgi:hypothetical protein
VASGQFALCRSTVLDFAAGKRKQPPEFIIP